MYSPDKVYKIKTKDGLHFTAKIVDEDQFSIKIVSEVDGQEDILSKENILKARLRDQNSTGGGNGKKR